MVELMNCPMMNKKIDLAYCLELQMISNNEIKKTADEKEITEQMWDICRRCPKQECPTPDYVVD